MLYDTHLLLNPELTVSAGLNRQLALGCPVSAPCAMGVQARCSSYMAFTWVPGIRAPPSRLRDEHVSS